MTKNELIHKLTWRAAVSHIIYNRMYSAPGEFIKRLPKEERDVLTGLKAEDLWDVREDTLKALCETEQYNKKYT